MSCTVTAIFAFPGGVMVGGGALMTNPPLPVHLGFLQIISALLKSFSCSCPPHSGHGAPLSSWMVILNLS